MNNIRFLANSLAFRKSLSLKFKEAESLNLNKYKQAIIIHSGLNPTNDYFFAHQEQIFNINICERVDLSQTKELPHVTPDTLVIVIRYFNDSIIKWLKAHKKQGGAIVLFMDDDLPSNIQDLSLPWQYRIKLWNFFGRYIAEIEKLCSELWVSTKTLQNIYQHLPTKLIIPNYKLAHTEEQIFYFYHGSPSTHRQDIEWLRTVIELTQSNSTKLSFMIIGNKHVKQLFANIPKVIILHTMSWSTYIQTLPYIPHHIGLAPLTPTSFNATRSPTKFFDFTRLNAVGIYADTKPYKDFVRSNYDGILLNHDPEEWSKNIIQLAENQQQRLTLLHNARQRLLAMT